MAWWSAKKPVHLTSWEFRQQARIKALQMPDVSGELSFYDGEYEVLDERI